MQQHGPRRLRRGHLLWFFSCFLGLVVAPLRSAAEAQGVELSDEVGETCISALAAREGRSRQEVLTALTTAFAGKKANAEGCDLAVATASPVGIYLKSLTSSLKHSGTVYQLLVSAVAIGVGLACAWDGPMIWRALFTTMAAVAAAGVTHHEATLWGLAPTLISELVLMAQAAAAVALAVHVGFEGSQVLFGVLLGLLGAYGLGDWARSFEERAPGISLLWYEMGAVVGFLLYTVWRKAVLSTLAPLVGGFLVTSGGGVLLSRIFGVLLPMDLPFLPPRDMPWLLAATTLLGKAGAPALTVHCAGAMLATLLHGCLEVRWITIVFLTGNIVTAALSASTGCFCQVWPSSDCPPWLQRVEDWHWPVLGCLLWALLTGLSAWRQLGLLEHWEASNFWRSETALPYSAESGDAEPAEGGVAGHKTTEPPYLFDTMVSRPGYERMPAPRVGAGGGAPQWAASDQHSPLSSLVRGLEGWWTDVGRSSTRGNQGR